MKPTDAFAKADATNTVSRPVKLGGATIPDVGSIRQAPEESPLDKIWGYDTPNQFWTRSSPKPGRDLDFVDQEIIDLGAPVSDMNNMRFNWLIKNRIEDVTPQAMDAFKDMLSKEVGSYPFSMRETIRRKHGL